jgi:hypothetical protein
MKQTCSTIVLLLSALAGFTPAAHAQSVAVTGELKRWHKVTLTLDGPAVAEGDATNPFMDYRMNVTFSNTVSGLTYKVPGYFAADGDAANSSATSGNKWRAHLSPDDLGNWTYTISFRTGVNVAVNASAAAGSALAPYDGVSGSFSVAETDKTGRDFRGKGRLKYVGKHHLQFADGTFFLKAGADAPENFLAYSGFDNVPSSTTGIKSWSAHVGDWNVGDPTWKSTQGKGIIGAVNYLSEKGCNAQSFLTYSVNGDTKNVFPYIVATDRLRMDCSKVDQWEIVFTQFDKMGMYLHFKTQETENDQDMDGGALGNERKLYYRELIARFAHHLGLNWNLGEENSNTDAQRKAFAQFFYDNDPYHHNIVLHTLPSAKHSVYTPMLGTASKLTGASLQSDASAVFADTKTWVNNSAASGVPWVVAIDEQGPAGVGIKCDSQDATHNGVRADVLWGNIMAGGAGVESYYGYQTCATDLDAQDHRTRSTWWNQCRYALEFFNNNGVPFQDMGNQDNLVSVVSGAHCLRKAGEAYVVYTPGGGSPSLNLAAASGSFEVKWYDPRNGGALQNGSVLNVTGGGTVSLGIAPSATTSDWVVLVRVVGGLFVNAGVDQNKMFPQATNLVSVTLDGTVSSGGNPSTSAWSVVSGPGTVTFANSNAVDTTATIVGSPGNYVLKLAASSLTNNAADTMTVVVSAYVPDTTPPVVLITFPADNGQFQTGAVVNVTATVTDAVGVQAAELYVDGVLDSADTLAPYSWSLNGLSAGAHTLAVRGLDTSTNAATNSVTIAVYANPPAAGSVVIIADTFNGTAQTGTAAPLTYTNTGIDVPSSGTLTASLANNSAPAGSLSVSVIYAGALTGNQDLDGSYSFAKNGTAYNFGADLAGKKWVLTFTAKTTGTTAVDKFFVGVSDASACLIESDFDIAIQMGSGTATNDGQGIKVLSNGNAKKNVPNTTTALSGNTLHTYVLTVDETGGAPNYTLQMDGTNMLTANTSFGAFASTNRYVVFDIFDRATDGGGVNVGQVDALTLEVIIPPDVASPTGSFVTPTNSQSFVIGQPVPVSLTATDNVAVLEVHLAVDSLANEWDIIGTPPYDFTVTGLAPGPHELLARIIDTSYNELVVTQVITVSLPPAGIIGGSLVAGGLQLNWTPTNWLLEKSPNVTGGWLTVTGATSPFLVPVPDPKAFYRTRQP